jgi:hypothetical protein
MRKMRKNKLSGYEPEKENVKTFNRNTVLINKGNILRNIFIIGALFMLFGPQASAQIIQNVSIKKSNVFGYLITQSEKVDESFGGGYSMYVPAYPLVKDYPGREFQSGLFGTWMHPKNEKPLPIEKMYIDVEGGLGWWRDTEYATETPKFIMGGVQLNFVGWANGVGAGQGRNWDTPKGKYGVAQLSPWVLWPPDGLNIKQGTCGEMFGSGYLPLPLTEPKEKTAGTDVSTGNQCWTLFLNTANFKGPLTFFTPYFWSEASTKDPRIEGLSLDQRPSEANKAFQQETQHIHSAEAADSKGVRYARMAPTNYPTNQEGISELLHRRMVYNKKALWNDVEAWFKGGKPADSKIKLEGAADMVKFKKNVRSSWGFRGDHIPKDKGALMNITSFMNVEVTDDATLKIEWKGDLVTRTKTEIGGLVTLPEYYKLVDSDKNKNGEWIAVAPEDVPKETGLHSLSFKRKYEGGNKTYVTPEAPVSCWKTPGPVAGPFRAKLGDGSTVTYFWYKFCDQPALLNAAMSKKERMEMQRRVELLHRHWTKDREYLPPATVGKLAELDPALFVTPPKGMEIGYVPIVTRQGIE